MTAVLILLSGGGGGGCGGEGVGVSLKHIFFMSPSGGRHT